MRWERRKPFWPIFVGLATLLALAIAAPYCWQHPVLNVHELMGQIEPSPERLPLELQPLPLRTSFDTDKLRDFCSSLQEILRSQSDSDTNSTPVVVSYPRPALSTRVMVSSSADRLAMALPDDRRANPPQSISALPAAAESTREEAHDNQKAQEISLPVIRHRPMQLIQRLETLGTHPQSSSWVAATLTRVNQLTDKAGIAPESSSTLLAGLRKLAEEGRAQALEIAEPAVQQNWLQAAEGLQRRLGIWELLLIEHSGSVEPTPPSTAQLVAVLGQVGSLLSDTANGQMWHDYLLLDQIAQSTSEGLGIDHAARHRLAQEVLSRTSDPRLTKQQQTFLATPPLADLQHELKAWAAGPVDLQILLALVERYEVEGQLRFATAISQLAQRLQWSQDAKLQALAADLQDRYRGANMRLAISEVLLNRMIPEQKNVSAPVRERIAGRQVQGRSRTTTEVKVQLLPSDTAWQFGLQASGRVYSQTRSDTWPVNVRNAARYEYEAQKKITIDPQGLKVAPAQADARGRHEFLGADSQFDRVPILGALFRDIAKRQNQKSRSKAMTQVKSKVAGQARHRMDQETNPKLSKLEQKFRTNVLIPFGQLALDAEPVSMVTTDDRAVMQLRLANLDQLAAHSPRPSAPSDSMVSMQVHQSALNNALEGLGLEGRRLTLLELHQLLAEKLRQTELAPPADLPTRAVIEFAPHDAIHIAFSQDRFELVLNIRELAHGRDKIRNFQVHTFYRPKIDGLAVQLIRDETLQFSGYNLRTGPRVVLHSVMGKLFAKGQAIEVFRKEIEADSRLSGLMVTQLVIDDGWIALAIGPAAANRTAWRTPSYQ